MTVSELMQAMADAGAPFEAIVIAVKAVEEARAAGEVKERTRSKAAERQARYRERHKSSQSVTCDAENVTRVTPEITRDAERNALPLSPSPLPSPQTPEPTPHPHTPENNTTRAKGHRLPDDWQPKPLTGDAAQAAAGWPPGALDRELARFRDWAASATGPNARKSNWDAAWRNWIRKADDDGRYRNNRNGAPGHHGGRDNRDGFKRACDDWIDEAGRSATGGNGAGGQLALGRPDSL
ncbi:hypothetical protein [Sphingopyxis indica]|uniref:hypothetical protein n=1 Tax=Sphingopyxis indica TaxID=436663 RepID=UPI00113022AD|nr:hypothetical protein [Sphingopyxis indica]